MTRSLCLIGIFLVVSSLAIEAQEQQTTRGTINPGLRRRSLVMEINVVVMEDSQVAIWNESQRRIAIPGTPVGIRLEGSNVIVAVQFTPVVRRQGNVLVAQGQIWIEDPQGGVSYYTLIQTIPMEFNEPIYFFPLGTMDSSIQITLIINPYTETSVTENEN